MLTRARGARRRRRHRQGAPRRAAGTRTVRYIGVDTPETRQARTTPVQCFGKQASAFNERLVTGSARAAAHRAASARDRYGRLLAYVYVPAGRHRVRQRGARAPRLRPHARDPAEHRPRRPLRRASSAARASRGRGLWTLRLHRARQLSSAARRRSSRPPRCRVVADDHDLRRLLERPLDRRLDHVVALLQLLAGGRAARLGGEEVRSRRGVSLGAESVCHQQRLDALLVERLERVGQPATRALVARPARSAAGRATGARGRARRAR